MHDFSAQARVMYIAPLPDYSAAGGIEPTMIAVSWFDATS